MTLADTYVDAAGAARILGVKSRTTVTSYVRDGHLTVIGVMNGGNVYERAQVEQFAATLDPFNRKQRSPLRVVVTTTQEILPHLTSPKGLREDLEDAVAAFNETTPGTTQERDAAIQVAVSAVLVAEVATC